MALTFKYTAVRYLQRKRYYVTPKAVVRFKLLDLPTHSRKPPSPILPLIITGNQVRTAEWPRYLTTS